ncbi:MAG: DUF3568 family protein [Desulfobacteraceae bacterium]|nr:MAG: DUF3568 family protein [Desulfobacteraceae bacterium]
MKIRRGGFLALTMVLLSLWLTSCAAVVAGGAGAAAAYTYIAGWMSRDYDASLDEAYQASLDSFKENNITVVERSKELASAQIKAESPEQTYWVKLESKGDKMTNVAVRAGLMGNQEASKKIHTDIEENL